MATNSNPREASSRRWLLLGICAFIGLAIIGFIAQQSQPRGSGISTRGLIFATQASRRLFLHRVGAITLTAQDHERLARECIDTLARLAQSERSTLAYRRLALARYNVGSGTWANDLALISNAKDRPNRPALDAELALWRRVLTPNASDIADLESTVQSLQLMQLGWFQNIAIHAIHVRSANQAAAERVVFENLRGERLSEAVEHAVSVALAFGFGLGVIGIVLWFRRRHDPDRRLPALMQVAPPVRPTIAQSRVMTAIFVTYLIADTGLRYLIQANGSSSSGFVEWSTLALSIIVRLLALTAALGVWLYGRSRAELKIYDLGFRRCRVSRELFAGILGYWVAFPALAGAGGISLWLFQGTASPVNPAITAYSNSFGGMERTLIILEAVVVAPILEEFLFRGLLLRSFMATLPFVWAAVLSSTLFALMHVQLPFGFLGLFSLGLLLSGLYYIRGTLAPCFAAHILNNTVILISISTLT